MAISITISFQAREHLLRLPIDETLVPGARNAVRDCLGIQAGQEAMVITEVATEDMAAMVLREIEAAGAKASAYIVSEAQATAEPFIVRLEAKLAEVDASFLIASTTGLPPSFRRRIISCGGARRRHAHMVGLTPPMMLTSMRADYVEVKQLGDAVLGRIKPESTLHVRTPAGTDLRIKCARGHRWVNASGVLRTPGWTNLPGGELYTTPATVDGRAVADGGVWMSDTGEIPRSARLTLTFEDGRATRLTGDDEAAAALAARLDGAENGRRVGQIGLGTNTGVVAPIGALLQDLKMPGFHLSLGHTCSDDTGATWSSPIEVPVLLRRADAWLDGTQVMQRGRWLRDQIGRI